MYLNLLVHLYNTWYGQKCYMQLCSYISMEKPDSTKSTCTALLLGCFILFFRKTLLLRACVKSRLITVEHKWLAVLLFVAFVMYQ